MIIGLTGTLGAGKDTVAEFLKNQGFFYISLSDLVREECDLRGLPRDRDTLQKVANELRKEFGWSILAKRALERIQGKKILMVSLRHPAEIEELKKQGEFYLIFVEAPIELRYERIKLRKRTEDFVSFEKFKAQEELEKVGLNANSQQLNKVFLMADFTIINDGTIEELYRKIDEIIKKIYGIH